jgi:hypothetical protein
MLIPNRSFPPVTPNDENYDTYFQIESIMLSQAVSGSLAKPNDPLVYKLNKSSLYYFPNQSRFLTQGITLPPGERVNVYNTRKKYFDGVNKIKVTFSLQTNGTKSHYDNTLTVLSTLELEPGTLL